MITHTWSSESFKIRWMLTQSMNAYTNDSCLHKWWTLTCDWGNISNFLTHLEFHKRHPLPYLQPAQVLLPAWVWYGLFIVPCDVMFYYQFIYIGLRLLLCSVIYLAVLLAILLISNRNILHGVRRWQTFTYKHPIPLTSGAQMNGQGGSVGLSSSAAPQGSQTRPSCGKWVHYYTALERRQMTFWPRPISPRRTGRSTAKSWQSSTASSKFERMSSLNEPDSTEGTNGNANLPTSR